MIMKRFIDHLIRSDAVEMESARFACGVPRPYVFTVAAGILPAVEPGILPGGNGVLSGNALAIWRPRPGGKMPPLRQPRWPPLPTCSPRQTRSRALAEHRRLSVWLAVQ